MVPLLFWGRASPAEHHGYSTISSTSIIVTPVFSPRSDPTGMEACVSLCSAGVDRMCFRCSPPLPGSSREHLASKSPGGKNELGRLETGPTLWAGVTQR